MTSMLAETNQFPVNFTSLWTRNQIQKQTKALCNQLSRDDNVCASHVCHNSMYYRIVLKCLIELLLKLKVFVANNHNSINGTMFME